MMIRRAATAAVEEPSDPRTVTVWPSAKSVSAPLVLSVMLVDEVVSTVTVEVVVEDVAVFTVSEEVPTEAIVPARAGRNGRPGPAPWLPDAVGLGSVPAPSSEVDSGER
jgi:hypothetical protein